MPYMYNIYLNGPNLVTDEEKKTIYFTYSYYTEEYTRMSIEWSSVFKTSNWNIQRKDWSIQRMHMRTRCGLYGLCGPFGICKELGSRICVCMQGFEPKSIAEWSSRNWSGGCVRKAQLNCSSGGKGNGFLKIGGLKMPDFADWKRGVGDGKTCEDDSLKNCSCIALAYVSGIGCMNWGGDLIDIEEFSSGGENLYIRLADSELDSGRKIKWQEMVLFHMGPNLHAFRNSSDADIRRDGVNQTKGPELPIFDFKMIAKATRHFSDANKLGEGGFGPVYKGKLPDEQEIAVKRLSKTSGQGLQEFKNELMLISKLQHRNLVRLLGCCIEGEEKILIYEYMPIKGLDSFLFGFGVISLLDPSQQSVLDWAKRFHIVEGIARGLLYLHQDSRLKIIHSDLKASNILLDGDLNPKILEQGSSVLPILNGWKSPFRSKRLESPGLRKVTGILNFSTTLQMRSSDTPSTPSSKMLRVMSFQGKRISNKLPADSLRSSSLGIPLTSWLSCFRTSQI
ncbi:G-type lectin S-receptor-like serine/threonine-protein kinase At1g11330 [Magnolia sinica]|uniref:G-type lectin S-receptor-like serine/threonine-protein kinase At1g11330 n=1 Tax=Magnolia sinica TaxID=86752 RepID=UPI002658D1A2|nr:G-type lectin S-receptor-like serine/threonine-protein kinase At1g11330 [Magnolia sinica]